MKKIYRLTAILFLLLAAGVLIWTSVFFVSKGHHENENKTGPLIQVTTVEEEYRNMLDLQLLKYAGNISDNAEQAQKQLRGSIVQIVAGNLLGSGVVIEMTEQEIVIASVKHLVEEHDTVQIIIGPGDGTRMEVEGRIIGYSENYDLSYISVPVSEIGYDYITKIRYHEMKKEAFDELKAGDPVVQIGSTDGPAGDVFTGTVESKWVFVGEFNSFMIFNECFAKRGMSGGAALNAQGELLGIITGGDDTATVCMPINLVLEEYEKIRNR